MSLAVLARKHRAKSKATKATKGKCFYQAMTNRGSVRRSRVKVKKCAIGCKKGCTDTSITKPCQPFVQNSYRNHLRKIKEGCDCNVVLKCKLDTSASEEIEKVKAQTLHGRNHIEIVEYKLTAPTAGGGSISLSFGGITTTVNFNTDSITTMNHFITAFNNAKKNFSGANKNATATFIKHNQFRITAASANNTQMDTGTIPGGTIFKGGVANKSAFVAGFPKVITKGSKGNTLYNYASQCLSCKKDCPNKKEDVVKNAFPVVPEACRINTQKCRAPGQLTRLYVKKNWCNSVKDLGMRGSEQRLERLRATVLTCRNDDGSSKTNPCECVTTKKKCA